jgi:hypothetical protein
VGSLDPRRNVDLEAAGLSNCGTAHISCGNYLAFFRPHSRSSVGSKGRCLLCLWCRMIGSNTCFLYYQLAETSRSVNMVSSVALLIDAVVALLISSSATSTR